MGWVLDGNQSINHVLDPIMQHEQAFRSRHAFLRGVGSSSPVPTPRYEVCAARDGVMFERTPCVLVARFSGIVVC